MQTNLEYFRQEKEEHGWQAPKHTDASTMSTDFIYSAYQFIRIQVREDGYLTPFELDDVEWKTDMDAPQCEQCPVRFSLLNRRHHCRRCGSILCSKCTKASLPVMRMAYMDPVRICVICRPTIEFENEFFGVPFSFFSFPLPRCASSARLQL